MRPCRQDSERLWRIRLRCRSELRLHRRGRREDDLLACAAHEKRVLREDVGRQRHRLKDHVVVDPPRRLHPEQQARGLNVQQLLIDHVEEGGRARRSFARRRSVRWRPAVGQGDLRRQLVGVVLNVGVPRTLLHRMVRDGELVRMLLLHGDVRDQGREHVRRRGVDDGDLGHRVHCLVDLQLRRQRPEDQVEWVRRGKDVPISLSPHPVLADRFRMASLLTRPCSLLSREATAAGSVTP